MDVREIFEDHPYTRGKMFYDLCRTLEDLDEDKLLNLYDDIKKMQHPLEILDQEFQSACLFKALYEQYKYEDEYREKVLDPSIETLESINPSVSIAGFSDL